MLKLLVNNLKQRKVGLHELNSEELTEMLHYAVANQDFTLQREIGNHFTHIYDQGDVMPYWFKSEYDDDVTIMNFGRKDKVVDWSSVTLDDGFPLTHSRHKPLLNGFKNWLLAVSDPLENGGAIIKTCTVKTGVMKVMTLIDAILLRSAALELSRYHLSHITADFWLSLFKAMSEDGPVNGVYYFTSRTVELVKAHVNSITQEQIKAFVSKYPFVSRDIAEDDLTLHLTKEERVKACCWLDTQGYYKKKSTFEGQGNGSVLAMLLFEGEIASPALNIPTSPELWLAEKVRTTEYNPFNTENSGMSVVYGTIEIYISIAKLINTNIFKDNASSPLTDAIKALNVRKINDLVTLKPAGRTQTLHPDVVFKLTRQSFEFVLKYQQDILDACLLALSQAASKSVKKNTNKERPDKRRGKFIPEIHQNMSSTERGHFMQTKVMNELNEKAVKAMGIRQVLPFEFFAADKYNAIRNNESLFELYGVLIGSCQYLIGIISARRQDELISLASSGNLSPNKSPFEEGNEDIEYNLIFKLKKSGNGGKLSTNKIIERPITASLAKIIWRLEEFNEAAISQGVGKSKTLDLFNNLDARMCLLTKATVKSFNDHLDSICDYFETPFVNMDNGELRRQYVRQHQLRRFFALLFFWQKRFQGLEALRWMLGHTDMSHLYHYISSNEVGDILNGVKATVIVQGVLNKDGELEKIKNIGELKATLAKKYNAGAVVIDDLESVIDLADDDDITAPHIDQLKAEANLESNLEELLKTGEISLEPNFFKVTDEDGQVRETFNLAFQVKAV
ncbi:MAG TPA: integrase [Colwellia sp.]|nr:integrase [Colwellia sp.]|tara:strand:- start:5866 stop:8241 length:2376 start_codon:yes stop_codon:yes gene_type:complete